MTRAFLALLVTLAAVAACASAVEVLAGRPGLTWLVVKAAGAMFVACLVAAVAERLAARPGREALVLAYWVGAGLRGIGSFLGAAAVAAATVDPADRRAFWLGMLAAYLAVLLTETVRQVRLADREAARLKIKMAVPGKREVAG